ncbi:MAG TPA: NAD-dependent dehydratase [Candidatus Dormibacteraeota bacterium]|nr:NAD-dependent dehydratase [Candidatus Dormibacteraeota bacterium]
MKVLLLGASGLVGGEALKLLLADSRVDQVVAPTRRPLPSHAKLLNPVAPTLDELLPEAANWSVSAVICALGTTMAKAGSKEVFRHIDYELPLAFVKITHQRGAETFALTSSKGASASSPFFYTRTKGELEKDLQQVGFNSLLIVRPNIIGGVRNESRPAERVLLRLFGIFGPILPRGFRVSPASRIAEVLVEGVVAPRPGVHIVESAALT